MACSDGNVAAVVDISTERSRVEGFIPTGLVSHGGARAAFRNAGRAERQRAAVLSESEDRPEPDQAVGRRARRAGVPGRVTSGDMQTGTASWIEPFTAEQLGHVDRADAWPIRPIATRSWTSPIPLPQRSSTSSTSSRRIARYDQVLGDMKEGNGDPSLVLFGENITPNLHKLAREFVLLDNFYVNADVSADGHNWSTAAIAPDYVEKMWPNSMPAAASSTTSRSRIRRRCRPPAISGPTPRAAGVSMRNYGYMVNNKPKPRRPARSRSPACATRCWPRSPTRRYRGFDLDYPDVDRAKVFLADLAEFEKTGNMPRLILMRLGNDHTSGTAAGKIAPLSRRRPITITRWA